MNVLYGRLIKSAVVDKTPPPVVVDTLNQVEQNSQKRTDVHDFLYLMTGDEVRTSIYVSNDKERYRVVVVWTCKSEGSSTSAYL